MKILKAILWPVNWLLTVVYLWWRRVEWTGKIPSMNMLHPPQFSIHGKLTIGSGVKFLTHMRIKYDMQIDEGTTITHLRTRPVIRVDKHALMQIGNDVVFNNILWIRATEKIVIEDDVHVGPLVTIRDSTLHESSPGEPCKSGAVYLRRDCLIGERSCIKPGVEVGRHSIVGEGSIVTKSVLPQKKVAGNPAKEIGDIDCPDNYIRP